MDIEQLKDKLTDEEFAAITAHLADTEGKLKNVRKKADEYAARLRDADALSARMMERLGIASADELDNLPDISKQADAAKQTEARLKRLENELSAANKDRDRLMGEIRASRERATLAEALAGHDLIDADIVSSFVAQRLQWEGDELFYRSDDGAQISVKDGVSGLLKARPSLLKTPQARGSGVKTGARGANQPNPYSKAAWNITQQVELQRENPQLAAEMKAAAQKEQ